MGGNGRAGAKQRGGQGHDARPKGAQRPGAANFVRIERQAPAGAAGKIAAGENLAQDAALLKAGAGADGTKIFGQEAVDDEVLDRHPGALEGGQEGAGFAQAHFLGEQDGDEAAADGMAEGVFQLFDRGGQFLQEGIHLVATGGAAELAAEAAVFGEQGVQSGQPVLEHGGHGEQTEGVAGGSGVHHDGLVTAGGDPGGDFQRGHQFVQAREGKVEEAGDVALVQKSAVGGDGGEHGAVPGLEGGQAGGGVQLDDAQVGRGTDPARQSRTEWAGSVETRRKADWGKAAASWRAVAVAQAVLPAPPLPPKSRSRICGSARKDGAGGFIRGRGLWRAARVWFSWRREAALSCFVGRAVAGLNQVQPVEQCLFAGVEFAPRKGGRFRASCKARPDRR